MFSFYFEIIKIKNNMKKEFKMWIRDPKICTFTEMLIEATFVKQIGNKAVYKFIHPITKKETFGKMDKTFWEV